MRFEKIVQLTYHNILPRNNIHFETLFHSLLLFSEQYIILNSGLVGVPAFERTFLEFLCLFGYTGYAWPEVGLLHSLPYGDVS